MYKYLFGPVPSRRLGMSLGIDLVPHKVCSLNCVYCECGRTTNLTTERKEYVPVNAIFTELNHFLKENPTPDYITFSGAGEPTLNSGIGEILSFIKTNYPGIPVAVLTNGTLLSNKQVRIELLQADLVLPSLDAATEHVFHKINLPEKTLNIDSYIQGIIDFRNEYSGKINLEIFIIPGYNDHRKELDSLKEAILKINPDVVQLNTLDRPGTIKNLRAASNIELQNIVDYWNLNNVVIIASAPSRKKIKSYRKDTESAILETISRRPCTLIDLSQILGKHINEVNKYLDVLENEKKITTIEQERGLFYKKTKKISTT
ncbi:MAG: radical SAM protein [Prolixibacteraceae bacterium]|jgi:wyosine [tRNA(Phe)-imidazoG37] synthetase (radical SAM superfamily)|nr:radical SAM protein [Prolixibacteraceae bacterium]MBT6763027.1 radical SAM protein [Prolixibacteraceae bacterium]MBT6996799.1 radical SAM protein [Prolixibacteraceae bacterium]MBT7393797.1 radical SAM protein [Prolixibacteraceae bacterium]